MRLSIATVGGVDQPRHFLLGKNARESARLLRIGRQTQVPTPAERLEVEEPQSRQALCHGVGGELAIRETGKLDTGECAPAPTGRAVVGSSARSPQPRGCSSELME